MPIYNDKNALAKTEIGPPPTYIILGKKDLGSSINVQKIVCHHMKGPRGYQNPAGFAGKTAVS